MASANLLARFMTNPARVAWLANTTKLPVQALAAQAVILSGIADREGDQELKRFAAQLKQASKEYGKPANGNQQR